MSCQELQVDDGALLSVLQHLTCVDLAACACVSRQWHAVASSPVLWQQHLQHEFAILPSSLGAMQGDDALAVFQDILRDPCASVLSDLKHFCNLLSNIDLTQGWYIELELLQWPAGSLPAHTGTVLPTWSSHLAMNNKQDAAPTIHASCMQQAVLHPHHITRSTQGAWLSFTLPDWVADITAADGQGAAGAAQTVDLKLCASVSALSVQPSLPVAAPAQATSSAGIQQAAVGARQLLVIHEPQFYVPASEEELLLLSHKQGLYAWQDESGMYQLVCYLHMEQLLPLAESQLGLGTALHGRWGAVPRLPAGEEVTARRQDSCRQCSRTAQVPVLVRAPARGLPVHHPETASSQFCMLLHLDCAQLSDAVAASGSANSKGPTYIENVCDSFVLLLACDLPRMWLHDMQHDVEDPAFMFTACSTAGLWAQLPMVTGSEPCLPACSWPAGPAAARLHACHQLVAAWKQGSTGQALPSSNGNDISSTELHDDAAKSRLAAAKLQAALDREGMLDFSLYPLGLLTRGDASASSRKTHHQHCGFGLAEGRLLLGRCGVEIWQQGETDLPPPMKSIGQPAHCCKYVAHFLVDGVQQPLWANSLEFFFDSAVHECCAWGFVQLKLTAQAVSKLWGWH